MTALTTDFFLQQSPGTLMDAINQLPMFRQTTSASGGGGYTRGINSPDLRGLGPVRTLVLMNGRRLAPRMAPGTGGSSTFVDTNVIPASLIERVDVVTGGASAAYGSDAVAGVVNFILNDTLEGFRTSYHHAEDHFGGSREDSLQTAGGWAFAGGRGHIVFGVDAMKNGGVGSALTRDWTDNEAGVVVLGANRPAGVPSQTMSSNVEFSIFTRGGLILGGPLHGTNFGAGGQPSPLEFGPYRGSLTMVSPTQANYGANLSSVAPLKTPLERLSTLTRGTYEINDQLKLNATFGYASVESDNIRVIEQIDPGVIVLRNNPYLPEPTRQAMDAAAVTAFAMGRVHGEIGTALTDNSAEQWTYSAGIEGEIRDGWSWDFSVQRSRNTYLAELSEIPRLPNLYAALYAVTDPATGNIVCGPLDSNPMLTPARRLLVDPGCVPANPFGPNSMSEEARRYILGPEPGQSPETEFTQDVVDLNLRATPFSGWAGPVSMAAGASYRREKGDYTISSSMPNTPQEARYWLGNFTPWSGRKDVKEGYVEIGLPLVSKLRFADSLDFNGAVRVTDYSTSGTVTTWKAGLTHELGPVRLRGTRSRDIRAPDLMEEFDSGVTGVANIINRFTGQSGRVVGQYVRGIGLTPEEADTWTGGIVLQPTWEWLDGFSMSIDYFNITVKDVIAVPTAQETIDRCFAGQQFACDRVTFNPSSPSGIDQVVLGPVNANRFKTDGFDFEASYDVPMPSFIPGQVDLRALVTHTSSWITSTGPVTVERLGQQLPKWSWNVNLGYTQGAFTGNVIVTGHSTIYYDTTLIGPDKSNYDPSLPNSINDNTFPSVSYVSLAARYGMFRREDSDFEIFGSISNVFNKRPPELTGALPESAVNFYDRFGRIYKLGVRLSFQ